MSYRKGIDVSVYQGVIDWEKVKASGVECVMIRAGYGANGIDKHFKRNISECARLGIPCGVYWFSYALTAAMAKKEAACAIEAVKPYKLTLPIAFDFEGDSVDYATKKGVAVTKKLASAMCRAFCDAVKSAGYTPMVYTNPAYLSSYFDAAIPTDYDLWLAKWPGGTPDLGSPPADYGQPAIWQYTSSGSVAGVSGRVDMDAVYKDYAAEEKPETVTGKLETVTAADAEGRAARVKAFQRWLNRNHSFGIAEDGAFGLLTLRAAVMALQKWLNARGANLKVDGSFGPLTKAAVRTLQKNDVGTGVYILQGLLYRFGFVTGGFDGTFGTSTYAAVCTFQKEKKLKADGIAGQETFAALCRKVI